MLFRGNFGDPYTQVALKPSAPSSSRCKTKTHRKRSTEIYLSIHPGQLSALPFNNAVNRLRVLPAHCAAALRACRRCLPILNQYLYLITTTLTFEPSVVCHSAHLLPIHLLHVLRSGIYFSRSTASWAFHLFVSLAIVACFAPNFPVSAAPRACDHAAAAAIIAGVFH